MMAEGAFDDTYYMKKAMERFIKTADNTFPHVFKPALDQEVIPDRAPNEPGLGNSS